MNQIHKSLTKINTAIEEINNFIENKKYEKHSISYDTLIRFKDYFDNIKSKVEQKDVNDPDKKVYVARVIADNWPYNIDISEKLIDAEESYLKL